MQFTENGLQIIALKAFIELKLLLIFTARLKRVLVNTQHSDNVCACESPVSTFIVKYLVVNPMFPS